MMHFYWLTTKILNHLELMTSTDSPRASSAPGSFSGKVLPKLRAYLFMPLWMCPFVIIFHFVFFFLYVLYIHHHSRMEFVKLKPSLFLITLFILFGLVGAVVFSPCYEKQRCFYFQV